MLEHLLELVILYLVILDPLASFSVFSVATKEKNKNDQRKIATLSVLVAAIISFAVLFCGDLLLKLFSTNLDDFRVAGGIILAILGINMALGRSITKNEKLEEDNASAIAAIIGSPLLAGPATITTIIITTRDYGMVSTGLAIAIVLLFTGLIFYQAPHIRKFIGPTTLQVMSAILGLVTLAWGIKFIREGLEFL